MQPHEVGPDEAMEVPCMFLVDHNTLPLITGNQDLNNYVSQFLAFLIVHYLPMHFANSRLFSVVLYYRSGTVL